MSDVRPFEEYKEMIKDMPKEEMIRGLYDLSARVTKQENIIKEVREYIEEHTTYENYGYIDELQLMDLDFSIKDLKKILDKEVN